MSIQCNGCDQAQKLALELAFHLLATIDKAAIRAHNSAFPLPSALSEKIAMKPDLVAIGLLGIILNAGCAAHSSKPIIDPEGVDMQQYEADVASCEEIATQVEQKAGEGAARGALVGGLIGAVLGDSETVVRSAGVGAVAGGASGAATTEKEESEVVKNCLRNRGYKILN